VGTDGGAVEKRHAQRDATLLSASRPEFSRDGPPPGSVPVAPDNGLDRAPQIVMLRLALWAAFFNQRRQHSPLHIR
jgi:hypothetical protein